MEHTEIPALPKRPRDAHKGVFGKVLVLAGSTRYTGAAVLTGRAALRAGAGLVTIGCPESVHGTIASRLLCEISYPLPDSAPGVFAREAASETLDLIEQNHVVALGPGITTEASAQDFTRDIARLAPVPLVLDADGLNAFAGRANELAQSDAPRILTPHPGEASRMLERSTNDIVDARTNSARDLAGLTGGIVLLKGAGTVVTDGDRTYVNTTGNPGMATAGSGDVLTGMIAGLLAQGMEPFEATVLGAHLHGLAGDLGAAELGEHALMASDILDFIPAAIRRLANP